MDPEWSIYPKTVNLSYLLLLAYNLIVSNNTDDIMLFASKNKKLNKYVKNELICPL